MVAVILIHRQPPHLRGRMPHSALGSEMRSRLWRLRAIIRGGNAPEAVGMPRRMELETGSPCNNEGSRTTAEAQPPLFNFKALMPISMRIRNSFVRQNLSHGAVTMATARKRRKNTIPSHVLCLDSILGLPTCLARKVLGSPGIQPL